MNIFYEEPQSVEIHRLGEISRQEIVHGTYKGTYSKEFQGIKLHIEHHDPPQKTPDWSTDDLKKRIRNWKQKIDNGGSLFTAKKDGKLIGICILSKSQSDKCMKIAACFVDCNIRGLGVGKKLMQLAEEKAKTLDIQNIYVESNRTVGSVKFYQSMGYKIRGILDDSDFWIPIFDTGIILAKKLDIQN